MREDVYIRQLEYTVKNIIQTPRDKDLYEFLNDAYKDLQYDYGEFVCLLDGLFESGKITKLDYVIFFGIYIIFEKYYPYGFVLLRDVFLFGRRKEVFIYFLKNNEEMPVPIRDYLISFVEK